MDFDVGTIAIVTDAYNAENIGKIVRIERKQTMRERLKIRHHERVWIVSCAEKLKWNMGGVFYLEHMGPIPECQLQPIRDEEFHEWSKSFPQPSIDDERKRLVKELQRSEQRRNESIDPTKCEF